jgi:hypothetical protein
MNVLRLGRGALLLCAGLAAGCGPTMVKVSGRVLYDGKPVPGGTVSFRSDDRRVGTITRPIGAQGEYDAELPVGIVRVCVNNLQNRPRDSQPAVPPELLSALKGDAPKLLGGGNRPKPAASGGSSPHVPPPDPSKYVELPLKYTNADTSNLGFKVERDGHSQDIVMTK